MQADNANERDTDLVFVLPLIHQILSQFLTQIRTPAKCGNDTRNLAGVLFELLRELLCIFHSDDAVFRLQQAYGNAAGAHERAARRIAFQQRMPRGRLIHAQAQESFFAKAAIFLRSDHVVEVVQALLEVVVRSFLLVAHIPCNNFSSGIEKIFAQHLAIYVIAMGLAENRLQVDIKPVVPYGAPHILLILGWTNQGAELRLPCHYLNTFVSSEEAAVLHRATLYDTVAYGLRHLALICGTESKAFRLMQLLQRATGAQHR